MTAAAARRFARLAGPAGRALLVSAVVFWWGGVVAPSLISRALPDLLPSAAIPAELHPSGEGNLINTVSAAALAFLSLLALANVFAHRRRATGWAAVVGWAAVALASGVLAVEEVAELKLQGAALANLEELLLEANEAAELVTQGQVLDEGGWGNPSLWPWMLVPLFAAFFVVMAVFVSKGASAWTVRGPLVLGLAAWVFAVVQEIVGPFLFAGRASGLVDVLDETLEFSGTLSIALSAGLALQPADARPRLSRRRVLALAVGSAAVVAVLGGLCGAFLFRTPMIDTRAHTGAPGVFQLVLDDQMSAVQKLRAPAAPVGELWVWAYIEDRQGRPGRVLWRVMEDSVEGRILREGVVQVAASDHAAGYRLGFVHPLAWPEGGRLGLQLVAHLEADAQLRIRATKTDLYADGELWVNGAPTWPGQNLEFAAYGAPEPTLSKARALWGLVTSGWRWPVLILDAATALTLILVIPALLVASALPRRSRAADGDGRGGPSGVSG